jgi:hypothetical protein
MTAARPGPVPPGVVRHFTRSREQPRGVVWFGARSFWGHLRHLIASAIATESVDSRNWMEVDEPQALIQRIVEVLGGDPHAGSLVQALGRDLYIDFVADTGDDVAVSRAVARLLFASYELPDPDHPDAFLVAPRGDVLFFGGDTAYPVATAKEITNRLIVPWTQVLQAVPDDGRARVLLGLPGNHDWYDGLDGFGRMFRRPGHRRLVRRPRRSVGSGTASALRPFHLASLRRQATGHQRPGARSSFERRRLETHPAHRIGDHVVAKTGDERFGPISCGS